MNKKDAIKEFKLNHLNEVIERYESNGIRDIPARATEWYSFIDVMRIDGHITDEQYNNWSLPEICK